MTTESRMYRRVQPGLARGLACDLSALQRTANRVRYDQDEQQHEGGGN